MNILYVSSSDIVGGRFNGYVLHEALGELGYESHMAVFEKLSGSATVHKLGNPFLDYLNGVFRHLESVISLYSVLPVSALSIYKELYYRGADLIHLQLLHSEQFFSLFNIPFMSRRRPVVWTIHDPWLVTGHCIHPKTCDKWLHGCTDCPDLDVPLPIRKDRAALNWRIKRCVMCHSPVTLVCASRWMQQIIERSPMLSHLPCHLIPFGVDRRVFHPLDSTKSRKRWGIPEDAFVVSFRNGGKVSFKGTEFIEKALRSLRLAKPVHLITFDEKGGLDGLRARYPIIELGWTNDEAVVADAMRASDLFLMPSTAEAFGLMAIEAMACGTPTVVFKGTALPDVVHAPDAGIAVPYGDHEALTRAIEDLLDNNELRSRLGAEAVRIVEDEYTLERYIERHLGLYRSILGINRSDKPNK